VRRTLTVGEHKQVENQRLKKTLFNLKHKNRISRRCIARYLRQLMPKAFHSPLREWKIGF